MYKDRKEQREITETMNSLLLQLLPYLNSDTASKVRRALHLLGEIEIEPQAENRPRYCDRNICIRNEYNGISCDECEVTKKERE